jgi:hypothetical protein
MAMAADPVRNSLLRNGYSLSRISSLLITGLADTKPLNKSPALFDEGCAKLAVHHQGFSLVD